MSDNDIEQRLRATLAEQARKAPPGAALAERILAEVDSPARVLRPRHGWRTWTMPLLAAAVVAAVVATVVGIQNDRHTASPQPPAVSSSVSPTPTIDPTPTPTPTSTPTSTTLVAGPPDPNSIGLDHFQAIDTTFIGSKDGWALGNSDCLIDSAKTCAAMVYTTDGGASWHSMKQPPGDVAASGCGAHCYEHIRFATSTIGYAFGPSSFAMTTDGGGTWQPETGGADALETLNGNVIRVSGEDACGGPCQVHISTAPNGSESWTDANVPTQFVNGVQLIRQGSTAVVLDNLLSAHAGAIPSANLLVSTDNGHSWAKRDVPCPDRMGATEIAAGIDGSVSALCGGGANSAKQVVVTAPSATGPFARSQVLPIAATLDANNLGALSASTFFVSGADGLSRTTDAGKTWHRVVTIKSGDANYRGGPGFEDAKTGRWLTADGRTIWTTHDAGRTWHAFDFS